MERVQRSLSPYNEAVAQDHLREKAAALPETPGVYFMKDERGRVLYIGKARSLRARVSSYFHANPDIDPRLQSMISQIHDVDVLPTATEVDALLAEARLIKDTQPKYNVKLKDDKSFTMLGLTTFDDFPKVWVVRETDDVNADLMGPFTSASDLRESVKVLQKIFRFATCKIEMRADDEKRRFFRPCLLHSIRRCTAPCAARISKEDYAADIASLKAFLRGDRAKLKEDLAARMKDAARALEFERAADLRDQLRSIEALERHSPEFDYVEGDITPIDPEECLADLSRVLGLPNVRTVEGIDIAHLQGGETVGSLVAFIDGAPFKPGYRRYRIRDVRGVDDYAAVREVARRRFARLEREERVMPDVFLIDGGLGQLRAVAEALRADGFPRPRLLALAKREETLFAWDDDSAAMSEVKVEKSAPALRLLMYVRDEAHRFAQHYHHLLRRKAILEEDSKSRRR
ncbi:MAG: excinuclease ABC subunit UvrC [Planctomycetes bacterium]|nr:excinuclease ABC subunit UvrC [Planctomycetota bacterium]